MHPSDLAGVMRRVDQVNGLRQIHRMGAQGIVRTEGM